MSDVLIVGLGWAGGIVARELTRAGMDVCALERGPMWDADRRDFESANDEQLLRRRAFMQDTAVETWTFRHGIDDAAVPMRRLGAFTPGIGVGGSSLLYGGYIDRFSEWDFVPRTHTLENFGAEAIPEGSTLADWGITYADLEPYYSRFEEMVGVSGEAGNVGGRQQPRGNPFEAARSSEFPLVPAKAPPGPALFAHAAESLGYHPYRMPSGSLPKRYVNADGIDRPACHECGFCVGYPCPTGAKADAWIPIAAALETGRLTVRDHAYVVEVIHDGHRARGIRYIDAEGKLREQYADRVVLAGYTLTNVRLLLVSQMGTPYDPRTEQGSLGKNYSYHLSSSATVLYHDRTFGNYASFPTNGWALDDLNAERNDPLASGYLGGAKIQCGQFAPGPVATIHVPLDTPRWGRGWKRAVREWYDHDVSVIGHGQVLPYRDSYLDLDPRYCDSYGVPLLRITFDWKQNERALWCDLTGKIHEITSEMRGDHVVPGPQLEPSFNTTRYQSTHNTGGAMMGSDPTSSVVDTNLKLWRFENVWVVGGSALPQGAAAGPTGTICALAARTADAISREG